MSKKFGLKVTQPQIAKEVSVVGKKRKHPCVSAIEQMQAKIEDDKDWYPNKHVIEQDTRPGPKKVFVASMQRCVKESAEAIKHSGVEPTVNRLRLRCMKAAVNPLTGEFFDKRLILDVFKTQCYDPGAKLPWGYATPVAKAALSDAQIKLRAEYAQVELDKGLSEAWYYRNCVYVDPNYTILTIDPRSVFDEKQASKGKNKKRWVSPDKKFSSRNLRATPFAGKQCRQGDRKIWWHTIVARGKVHFEVMGADWEQTGEGQAELVAKLPKILRSMIGPKDSLPRTIVTDRGPGFFSKNGYFIREYKAALKKHSFKAYVGDEDATDQPGDLQDVWPHERVAAWAKDWLGKHPIPLKGGLDHMEDLTPLRLRACAKHINEKCNVDRVNRSWPRVMRNLKKAKGDRLKG